MRERLEEPLSLQDLARIALMSPYHFNRVFSQITGIPPSQFLSALRLEAAKRLLLTTDRNITDVCFDVGYTSLGSFITRFTRMVGQSPRHLRRLGDDGGSYLNQTPWGRGDPSPVGEDPGVVSGLVSGPDSFLGRVFIGLFPAPIPQGRPAGCAVLSHLGPYVIARVPDGIYHVLALGVSGEGGLRAYALCEDALRGRAGPVVVRGGRTDGPTGVILRSTRLTDVPILLALPFLLRAACHEASPAALEETGAAHGGEGEEPEERSCGQDRGEGAWPGKGNRR
jgi:AraC-like DNA-binding protein